MNQTLIDEIVALEWDMFQKTQNEGGRASCQDDYTTFRIMRSSQAMAWSEEMCRSWRDDLLAAKAAGRNLVTEKYARMMKYTVPAQYAALEAQLPALEPEAEELAAVLTAQTVVWAEQTAAKYPKVCGRGRSIHSSEDTPWNTSLETYSIGELLTYSVSTLRLFRAYYDEKAGRGENLHEEVEEYTARQFGYPSLAAAEAAMA